MKNSIDIYFDKIRNNKKLSAKEEIELSSKIRNGDKKALNKLVEHNLRLVASVAFNYVGQGMEIEDLVSEGNIGLIKAANKYDGTKGYRFSSYAVWWIRRSIIQGMIEYGYIKLPTNVFTRKSKIDIFIKEFENKNLRSPTIKEISESINIKESHIKEVINLFITSVDENYYINESDYDFEDKEQLDKLLSIIPERDRNILKMKYGTNDDYEYTLKGIGKKFNITNERVRQIINSRIKELQNEYRPDSLM